MPIIHHNSKSGLEAIEDRLSLNDEQFTEIAKAAEKKAKENYEAYEIELINFARLGYGYIGFILVSLVGCTVYLVQHFHGLGSGKLTIALVILIFVILKALWVKFETPTGMVLEREEFPKLFTLIDEICEQLETNVDVVLLDTDFNASVVQVPKAGILGLDKNYLTLGLTYMLAEDEPGFKATLAHEFGHLSGKHSETTRWIYYLQKRWLKLLENLNSKNILFHPFFAWYMPRFMAKALVMNRKHEMEADANATEFAGAEANSSSLVLMELKGRYLHEDIWKDIFTGAIKNSEPPQNVFTLIRDRINEFPRFKMKTWFEEALEREGDKWETHPPLKERLTIGDQLAVYKDANEEQLARVVRGLKPGESSAEIYLGEKLPELMEMLNTTWYEQSKDAWSEKHNAYKNSQNELDQLIEKEKETPLNEDELKQKAALFEELQEEEKAIQVYQKILETHPDDPVSNYSMGSYLAKNKNNKSDDALTFLQKSFKQDIRFHQAAKMLSAQYLIERNRDAELDLLNADKDEIDLALKERASIKESDNIVPHGLQEIRIKEIQDWARDIKEIKTLYLVRKTMTYFPQSKHFVFGLYCDGDDEYKTALAKVILDYANVLSGTISVVAYDTWTLKLEKKIREVPESLIFKR